MEKVKDAWLARRRRGLKVGLISVLLVALYVGTIVLFAQETERSKPQEIVSADRHPVLLRLTPHAVDPGSPSISFTLEIEPDSAFLSPDGLSLLEPIEVTFISANGARTTTFSDQTLATSVDIALVAQPQIEFWPFDSYRFETMMLVSHTVDDNREVLPVTVTMEGFVSGWEIDATQVTQDVVPGTSSPVPNIDFHATRALTTFAFAAVLLTLMILMAVLALTVAISVFRGNRKGEPAFLSWVAGMLFATPMLRSFLPGSPPIGSWVDILVVLWVLVSLVMALPLLVTAWWSPANERVANAAGRAAGRRNL